MSSRYPSIQLARRPPRGRKGAPPAPEPADTPPKVPPTKPSPLTPRDLTLEDYLQISEELYFFRTQGMTRH